MPAPAFPLQTARLTLRPFVETDFEALHAILSHPEVNRYLYTEPRTAAEVREALALRQRSLGLDAEGDRLMLAVVRRDSGEVVGDVMLRLTSLAHRCGEIGYLLHPDQHGQGLVPEAARELLRLAFGTFGLHRVIARCDGRNSASMRVMEKVGLRREAHFLKNEFVKGEWTDEVVYALLEEEWRGGN